MKEFIAKLPKATIATILGAILSYSQAKGYVDPDTAVLISTILVALGLGANAMSGKLTRK
jgi:hypothetical protein